MTLGRCDGETCCQIWRTLCEAYDEGRCEEVANEVKCMRTQPSAPTLFTCKLAPRLLHALKRDGWMEES